MNPRTEQEWQFSASTLDAVRGWLTTQPRDRRRRRLAPLPTLEIHDTYFDTADWRIHRAGYALRVRVERAEAAGLVRNEITLKALDRGSGALAKRIEISENVNDSDMGALLSGETAMAARLRDLIGRQELRPLFRVRTRRERQQLLEADCDLALAEVALDETAIEIESGVARRLTRVEVECLNAEPAAIAPWVDELRAAAQLERVEASKFGAGLAAAGLIPASTPTLEIEPLDSRQTFARSQRALLSRYFLVILRMESAIRLGSREAIHDMRVAARHLDVLLRAFSSRAPRWMIEARAPLRVLIRALGAVRDGDVQIALVEDCVAQLPDPDRAALAVLRERLLTKRREARRTLLENLDAEALSAWRETWVAHLGAGGGPAAAADNSNTASVARELVRKAARRLWKSGDAIDDESSAEELHAVRKQAKRLRYLIEVFADLWRDAADEQLRALGKLQDLLGDYHDAWVLAKLLADFATEESMLSPAASFAVGGIVQRQHHALEQFRGRFAKAYRRVRRRRWRALRRAMDDTAQSTGDGT